MARGTQIINGTEYVYEYDSTWNSEKKRAEHNRTYIGKMSDGVFLPNKKYLLQMELDAERGLSRKKGPAPSLEYKRDFYGATYLFDAIGQKLGVTDDLARCFPDTYRQILSVAYYLIMEDCNPLSRFPRWALTHRHPYGKDIPSQRSSELFGGIREDNKQRFFQLQASRRMENEYLAYDTTSISSYSKSIKQVRYGVNKDHDHLPQINLAMVFGESSRLPVCFRKLPGNIADVTTMDGLLREMDFLNIEKVKLVMDRGFYSQANINEMYRRHYKFVIAAKKSLKFVKERLDQIRGTILSRKNYSSRHGLHFDTCLMDWNYTETKPRSGEIVKDTRRMYLHIYYNAQRNADDVTAFNKYLDNLEDELLSGKRNPEHEKNYHRYFTIKDTPARGISLEPKQEAIDQAEQDYGFFALISNGVKDPLEALDIYRAKDLIEKAFNNLKERLNLRRTSVASEENLDGKLFVQFIALIYLSYIQKAMSDNGLFKDMTMHELLDQLDVIERFEQPGKKYHLGEITLKQRNLYALLGVDVPA